MFILKGEAQKYNWHQYKNLDAQCILSIQVQTCEKEPKLFGPSRVNNLPTIGLHMLIVVSSVTFSKMENRCYRFSTNRMKVLRSSSIHTIEWN